MNFYSKSIILLLFFSFGIFTSCQKDALFNVVNDLTKNLKDVSTFDIDLFISNIETALDGNTTGWALSVSQVGKSYMTLSGGEAVRSIDTRTGMAIPHSPTKRQEVASVSKTITALCLLNLLEKNFINVDTKLFKYLPKKWISGIGIREVTLRQLLTHTSGMPSGGIDYKALKNRAWTGGPYFDFSYSYKNINFAFLRIVIARLYNPTEFAKIGDNALFLVDDAMETLINDSYIKAVNEIVLSPAGIAPALPKPEDTDPTLNYNFLLPGKGWSKGDLTRFVGSTGWNLSAVELNRIMVYAKRSNSILTDGMRTIMNDGLLGWENDGGNLLNQTYGNIFGHGGYHEDKFNPNASSNPQQRGCFSFMGQLPIGQIELGVVVNSLGGTNNLNVIVSNAYKNAFK